MKARSLGSEVRGAETKRKFYAGIWTYENIAIADMIWQSASPTKEHRVAEQIKAGRDFSTFTLKAVTGLVVFLFALFLAVLTLSIMREWRDTEDKAEARAMSASQVVATNARWVAELSRQALGRIDEALGRDIEANAVATADLIRDAVKDLPGNVKAYVVAADGRTLFSTDPNVKPIDVRDREYFAEARGRRAVVFFLAAGQPARRRANLRRQQAADAGRPVCRRRHRLL